MAKFVNLVTPISEEVKRKIFIRGCRIEIFMEDWYLTVNMGTAKTAIAYAEGYKAAYEAMSICLDVMDQNEQKQVKVVIPFPTKFTYKLVPEDRRRTYEIIRMPKDESSGSQLALRGAPNLPWLMIFHLEACSFVKQVDSEEEAKAFVEGFSSGYHEVGVSIKKIESRTPLP